MPITSAQTASWKNATSQFLELWSQSNFIEANRYAESAVNMARSQANQNPRALISSLNNLAEVRRVQGKQAQAQQLLQEARQMAQKHLDPDDPIQNTLTMNLARVYEAQGLYEEAEMLFKQLLNQENTDQEQQVEQLEKAARFQMTQGFPNKAQQLLEEAQALLDVQGNTSSATQARVLTALAELALQNGNNDTAQQTLSQVETLQSELNTQHPDKLETKKIKARALKNMGKSEEAYQLLKEILASQQATLGLTHESVGMTLKEIADHLADAADPKAENTYQEALNILEAQLGKDHPRYAQASLSYAEHLSRLNRHSEAETIQQQALTSLSHGEKAVDPESLWVNRTLFSLSKNLFAQGRTEEALQAADLASPNLQLKQNTDQLPTRIDFSLHKIHLLRSQHKHLEAKKLHAHLQQTTQDLFPTENPYSDELRHAEGTLLESEGLYAQAEEAYHEAFEQTPLKSGHHTFEHSERAMDIARTLEKQEKSTLAKDWRLKATAYQLEASGDPLLKSNPEDTGWSHLNAKKLKVGTTDPRYQRYHQILNLASKSLSISGQSKSFDRSIGSAGILFERALEIYEELVGPDDPELTLVLDNYAAFLHDIGKHSAAKRLEARSISILEGAHVRP